ncbi:haloacid dehalogenase [Bradyrhizobium sp. SSBR45G]|uniref:TIGR01459 family HAD-type hydrolase n=1 Tax=unclassified Bradyrhizobium TaxID=2631580 RepID=UPI002342B59E|nr:MULTISPECIES: TIGR01459 family HAD-type hydrolase [unclassified Bradyrhizobium]GLH79971.1 haloacid dehalogenase [Bradyrhizobium sp. SSBR45G]GLH87347.1 haloacid dehalogenase [Bradyrhizobium sp. SSBR45R]
MTAAACEIGGLSAIADRFDHVLLDQWGTLHDGRNVFPAAQDCVVRLGEAGKHILVLSNSGKRAGPNAERLGRLGLPRSAYDGILTSGEVTWTGLRDRTRAPFTDCGNACFLITRGGDCSLVDGLDLVIVTDTRDADFILLGGLDDNLAEPDLWRDQFTRAAARRVPMICANPDLMMFGATGLVPAPGTLARAYEWLGGAVTFVGKPHQPIFAAALTLLGNPDPHRVLMIGDSLDHDVAGARAAGLQTLLLADGVHRTTLAGAPDLAAATRKLAASAGRMPTWTMQQLGW